MTQFSDLMDQVSGILSDMQIEPTQLHCNLFTKHCLDVMPPTNEAEYLCFLNQLPDVREQTANAKHPHATTLLAVLEYRMMQFELANGMPIVLSKYADTLKAEFQA